ncbi:MAG TPA: NAD(P)H-dependent oxidoreductase subunit E [Sulfurospirillum sp. UBA11407]|nr:MAG TPA: NAD(P)H-dependent oxidoreductase subunit E [Sulfurospirillum sp. UBA11407]
MSEFSFNKENEEKFQALLQRYPNKASLCLPSLWMIQYQEGWISQEAMVYLAQKLDTTPMEIQSIASFYTMFNLKPIGKYHIQLCKTLSCMLNGSENIRDYLIKKLGIKPGETSKDGKFTLSLVECLGSCGTAPVIQLNDDYIQNVTIEKLDEILDGLK